MLTHLSHGDGSDEQLWAVMEYRKGIVLHNALPKKQVSLGPSLTGIWTIFLLRNGEDELIMGSSAGFCQDPLASVGLARFVEPFKLRRS